MAGDVVNMLKRTNLLRVVLVVLVLLAASSVYAEAPVSGRAGRAEVRFLEGMIDHHQMAVDMAADCLPKATTDTVRTLCQNVIDAQTQEIETMRGWLLAWYGIEYAPMAMADLMVLMDPGMASGPGMGHGNHTTNPATDMPLMMGMMAGFDRVTGLDYDIAWLEAMIDHHDDALHMSERILRYAEHEDLRMLAQQIIDDQTAEIASMEAILGDIAPSS